LFASPLPVAASAGFLLAAFLLFSGCYTLTQGTTLLSYLGRAVPLESLLEEGVPVENHHFVGRVLDIRRFAMEKLGLKESKNYTRFVELDRDYLAAVVSACAPDSFTRYEWWFPIVGKMPYKGFFNVEDARKEAEKLRAKGLDVWIRGVDAFSTLGWFQDPLYSYMREYSAYQLANLLIHELLHATVFISGQTQFDEELAEFVGSEGARLYIIETFGVDSGEYREMEDSQADSTAFVAFLQELIAELEVLYADYAVGQGPTAEELPVQKAAVIKAAQERFLAEYETMFRRDNYRGFATMEINNAYLELYRLYYGENKFYRDLYERSGRDLPQFIAAAESLNRSAAAKKDPRKALEQALGL
jgi:predicted aminopeptidase